MEPASSPFQAPPPFFVAHLVAAVAAKQPALLCRKLQSVWVLVIGEWGHLLGNMSHAQHQLFVQARHASMLLCCCLCATAAAAAGNSPQRPCMFGWVQAAAWAF